MEGGPLPEGGMAGEVKEMMNGGVLEAGVGS